MHPAGFHRHRRGSPRNDRAGYPPRRRSLAAPAARGRALDLRAGGGCHHSRRIHPAAPVSGRAGCAGAGAEDRCLPAPHPGRAWRLAAVPWRRLRHQRIGESLFLPEDDWRQPGCAAHGARQGGHPRPRRRGAGQCLHALPAGAVRRIVLGPRAEHPGGDDPATRLVPGSYFPHVLLGAHRYRILAGPGGHAAPGPQSSRHPHPRIVHGGAAARTQGAHAPTSRLGAAVQRARPRAEAGHPLMAEAPAPPRHRALRRLRHGAAERRARAGRDLPRHGQCRDDVRCAGLSPGAPRPRHRPPCDREASGDPQGRSLLPALRIPGLGHRPGLPCDDGSRWGRGGGRRRARPRLAAALAGTGGERRLGGAAPGSAPRRLGLPVSQRPLPRPGRHRCRGDGHGPGPAAARCGTE
ncbi:MAG: hypothetical protein JWP20_1637 [Roseomonas sp.]|nr:hypothetical protein [Roseomonas sp.]